MELFLDESREFTEDEYLLIIELLKQLDKPTTITYYDPKEKTNGTITKRT